MPDNVGESKNAAIFRLYNQGVDPSTIAYGLDLSLGEVQSILSGREYLPSEEEIDVLGRRLATEAIDEARRIMRTGPAVQRIQMIRSILPNATKQLSRSDANDYESLRLAFEELLGRLSPTTSTPKAIPSDVGPEAPIIEADYTSEED